jgi:DNA modification methylase
MSNLVVTSRLIAELVPYARNARTHSPAQVEQIAKSIQAYGFTSPVLVDENGGIIAGHGRVLAMQSLGRTTIDAIELRGLSEIQRRGLILADNRIAQNAGWDKKLLALELSELKVMDFDLEFTGFSGDELDALLAGPGTGGLTDPDEVPAAPVNTVTSPGDVWLLGRHRLACGDCTDPDTVARALNGVKPHLMVTDPPYGVEYDPGWRNEALKHADLAVGKVANDHIADWRLAWALFPGEVAYVWHADKKSNIVAESLIACGFELRAQIIWAKQQMVISQGDYHHKHEPCWYVVRKSGKGHYCGDRKQTTLWEIDKPRKSETGHSTQKPIECMKKPIENNSSPGQAIYEPFSGSGTTIIAAEMTARACHAIEIKPEFADIAVTRWQKFTGLDATLERDGRTFAEHEADAKVREREAAEVAA